MDIEEKNINTALVPEDNPQESAEVNSAESFDKPRELSPMEMRGQRRQEIDAELAGIITTDMSSGEIESARDREYNQKIEELKQGLGAANISEETAGIIHQRMVDDVVETARSENRHIDELNCEREQLEHLDNAEHLLDSLSAEGAIITPEHRAELMRVLSSPEVVDFDRKRLADMMGINDRNVREKIDRNPSLHSQFEKILRNQLVTNEYKEMLLASDVKIVGGDVSLHNGEAGGITDVEMAKMGPEGLKDIIRKIVSDPESVARQGMFWNALISKDVPYVIKTQRQLLSEQGEEHKKRSEEYRVNEVMRYPQVREAIGAEFLPKQAVMRSESGKQMHIIQEKVPTERMKPIKPTTIDDLLLGQLQPEITAALSLPANKAKLQRFIAGVETMITEQKRVIDVIGSNLFIGVDEKGVLDIKLIDYGSFSVDQVRLKEDVDKSMETIEKLKTLAL